MKKDSISNNNSNSFLIKNHNNSEIISNTPPLNKENNINILNKSSFLYIKFCLNFGKNS